VLPHHPCGVSALVPQTAFTAAVGVSNVRGPSERVDSHTVIPDTATDTTKMPTRTSIFVRVLMRVNPGTRTHELITQSFTGTS
jgi:hypothetical protein